MRFLIQECADALEKEGKENAGPGSEKRDGKAKGKEAEPFAYVSAAWHPSGELFACGDNALVAHWQFQQQNHSALPLGTFASFNEDSSQDGGSSGTSSCVTCCAWHPRGESLACAIAQGSFKLVSRQGRVDKTVASAHEGACIGVRWNLDGTALATCGEDGKVKLWSKTGMLRSTLASENEAVYCVAFSPDSNQLALSSGKHIVIKRIGGTNAAQRGQYGGTNGVVVDQDGQQNAAASSVGASSSRSIRWKAHSGVVLSLDWSVANGKILSGGEDGKYKVWDAYGRLLYQSKVIGHEIYRVGGGGGGGLAAARGPVMPVTSVRWRPSGESFAVGTFDLLLLCDESGWIQHKASPKDMDVLSLGREGGGQDYHGVGEDLEGRRRQALASALSSEMPSSVLSLAWSVDGTQLACTNGNGSVFIVMILGEVKESGAISLVVSAPDTLRASFTCVLGDSGPGSGSGMSQGGPGGASEGGFGSDFAEEDLHFGSEKILGISVGFGRVLVVTHKQMYVYTPPDWHSPQLVTNVFSPEMPVKLMVQGPKCVATVDTGGSLKVLGYDSGRVQCQPKFQGMRADLMSGRTMSWRTTAWRSWTTWRPPASGSLTPKRASRWCRSKGSSSSSSSSSREGEGDPRPRRWVRCGTRRGAPSRRWASAWWEHSPRERFALWTPTGTCTSHWRSTAPERQSSCAPCATPSSGARTAAPCAASRTTRSSCGAFQTFASWTRTCCPCAPTRCPPRSWRTRSGRP